MEVPSCSIPAAEQFVSSLLPVQRAVALYELWKEILSSPHASLSFSYPTRCKYRSQADSRLPGSPGMQKVFRQIQKSHRCEYRSSCAATCPQPSLQTTSHIYDQLKP